MISNTYNPKVATLIDAVSISLDITPPKQAFKRKEFLLNGNLLFVPQFNQIAEVTRFTAKHKNLDIRLYPNSGKAYINNSLAKYHHGNNYQDLTAIQIEDALNNLSDELHLDVMNGDIKRLEYGCVIEPNNVNSAINCPLYYKGRQYEEMKEKGHKYGSKCRYTDYSIKGYNKSFEVKNHEQKAVPDGLFRWEVAVRHMRYLRKRKEPINLYKGVDLTNPEILQYLANDLVEKYRYTMKKETIDYYGLTTNELNVVLRMQHVPEVIKKNAPHTYKKDRRLYRAIVSQFSDSGEHERTAEQLQEKCRELINS